MFLKRLTQLRVTPDERVRNWRPQDRHGFDISRYAPFANTEPDTREVGGRRYVAMGQHDHATREKVRNVGHGQSRPAEDERFMPTSWRGIRTPDEEHAMIRNPRTRGSSNRAIIRRETDDDVAKYTRAGGGLYHAPSVPHRVLNPLVDADEGINATPAMHVSYMTRRNPELKDKWQRDSMRQLRRITPPKKWRPQPAR